MTRQFLNSKDQAIVRKAAQASFGQEFRDRVALGSAIGQCYKAGYTRDQTIAALQGLTADEKDQAIARWETNRRAYNLPHEWPVK